MKEYLDFQDVLIMPEMLSMLTSRSEPILKVNGSVPLSIANMENIGTLEIAMKACRFDWKTYINKHTSISEWKTFFANTPWSSAKNVIPTFGFTPEDYSKMKELWYAMATTYGGVEKTVCFDLANGHACKFWNTTRYFLKEAPFTNVIFGNFGNPDTIHYFVKFMKEEIEFPKIKSIGLKFGIGSGSVCTTRLMTGVGTPQYTLISNARLKLEELKKEFPELMENVYIISDGGIRNPGDVTKAFVAGAHEVMMGGMFAGLHETGTHFYGSSSAESKSYKASNKYSSPEGKSVSIERNMGLAERIVEIENGLRSAMTYLDIENIKALIDGYPFYQKNIMTVRRQTDNYQ